MIPEPGDANREITVTETFHLQTDDELSDKELKQIEADDQAIQTILLGSDIRIQEKKAKLFNEWERFTFNEGESIESYYHCFLKLMNDLKRNKHFPEKIANLDELKKVNANCILMANLQQALTLGTQTESAPVYDTDGSAENNNDVISEDTSVEQGGETVKQHLANFEETRALYESSYQNLAIKKRKLKSDFKTREDELLDKQIQLEKKIKELNNISLKMGQSIQMLSPKPDSFYHTKQKMDLGYQNPFYLKQAQKKQQSLYDGKVLLEKHDPPVVHDSEETLQLAQESVSLEKSNKNVIGLRMLKLELFKDAAAVANEKFDANMKFLFKSREEMEKEDEDIIKSINETPAQKATKRRKLSEEAQEADDLRKRLEIVQDEDDDIFVKATPLAQKVPVMDYQVVVIDNKPNTRLSEQMTLINSTSASQLY
nr:hypothetical protein [Tanacetum cinerariifolium]